jgi:hypothetical protein
MFRPNHYLIYCNAYFQKTPQMAKKSFDTGRVFTAPSSDINAIDKIVTRSVVDGNSMIKDLIDGIPDMTTPDPVLAIAPALAQKVESSHVPSADEFGEETNFSPENIAAFDQMLTSGAKLGAAQQAARDFRSTETYGTTDRKFVDMGERPIEGDQPEEGPIGDIYKGKESAPGSSERMNKLGIKKAIDLYDGLQGAGAIFAYGHFLDPKVLIELKDTLQPLVLTKKATDEQTQLYSLADKKLSAYFNRKERYAGGVFMDAENKQFAVDVLSEIMAEKGMSLSPYSVLALVLLAQPIMNTINLMSDKWGFSSTEQAEAMAKFQEFLGSSKQSFSAQKRA